MNYEINGKPFPVVECTLEKDESINCEGGAMSYMSNNMEMTTTGGGFKGIFSKAISGENLFSNTYTARDSQGMIAFASKFPGEIKAIEINENNHIILQKSAYLASTPKVEKQVVLQKKFGAGLFAGEGFIMQRIYGEGIVFVELDGSIIEKELQHNESLVIDTGYVAMMDASCKMDIQQVKGFKNMFLGGEGMFNTVVTGPGRVWIQTMPIYQLAQAIIPYIPQQTNTNN